MLHICQLSKFDISKFFNKTFNETTNQTDSNITKYGMHAFALLHKCTS